MKLQNWAVNIDMNINLKMNIQMNKNKIILIHMHKHDYENYKTWILCVNSKLEKLRGHKVVPVISHNLTFLFCLHCKVIINNFGRLLSGSLVKLLIV